jgi:probable phosphoglycerate mutase
MRDLLMSNWQPSQRRRIYLVRHGDVSYFDDAGKPFRPDTVPLNDVGRRQAEALARELSCIPIDRVVSSDLPRCLETATILTSSKTLKLETYAELREVRPGRLAELAPEDAIRGFLGAFTAFDRSAKFLGGETYGELADRVLPCFHRMLEDKSWKHLLVVAHGGVNRVILARTIGKDLHAFATFEQDPCCLNVIDVADHGPFLIRLVNATPYDLLKRNLQLTTMERLLEQYRVGFGHYPATAPDT